MCKGPIFVYEKDPPCKIKCQQNEPVLICVNRYRSFVNICIHNRFLSSLVYLYHWKGDLNSCSFDLFAIEMPPLVKISRRLRELW